MFGYRNSGFYSHLGGVQVWQSLSQDEHASIATILNQIAETSKILDRVTDSSTLEEISHLAKLLDEADTPSKYYRQVEGGVQHWRLLVPIERYNICTILNETAEHFGIATRINTASTEAEAILLAITLDRISDERAAQRRT